MKCSLIVADGPHQGKVIPVSKSVFSVGRDPKCNLRPASMTISKRHCEFLVQDGKFILRDLGSTNGTILNENQIEGEQELRSGDSVRIGPLSFTVKIESEAEIERPTHVDSQTRVPARGTEIPAPARTAPAAATAAPAAAEPPRAQKGKLLDDDAIAWMLMDEKEQVFDDQEQDVSTTMMIRPVALEDLGLNQAKKENTVWKPPPPPTPANTNTSSAAQQILEKYRRKPKT